MCLSVYACVFSSRVYITMMINPMESSQQAMLSRVQVVAKTKTDNPIWIVDERENQA